MRLERRARNARVVIESAACAREKKLVTPSNLGIRVEEERGPDQSIARLGTARTAFVGRTLRGPVDRPIFITSFTEFQHVFGGLWQPSPLGYAVEQFFDNGGREALIVRVVNGARSATLTLGAGAAALRLRAVRPGTREFLRASVDYDNIPAENTAEFNLTVQRVRAQGTAQVEDQEIFRRLSLLPAAEGYLPRAIVGSELIRAGRRGPGAAARSNLGCGQRTWPAATSIQIPTAMTVRRSPTMTSSDRRSSEPVFSPCSTRIISISYACRP